MLEIREVGSAAFTKTSRRLYLVEQRNGRLQCNIGGTDLSRLNLANAVFDDTTRLPG